MENKRNAAFYCHVILMCIMLVLSCISAGIVFFGKIPEGYEVVTDAHKTASLIMGISHAVNALALAFGIAYMMKGATKAVAGLYKAFLLLATISVALRLAGKIIFPGFDVAAGLLIGCVLMLLILTFGKDLGREKTWCAFFILMALDIAVAILFFDKREAFSSIASGLTRLVVDGTIGIAITAKYKDKATRGK